MRIARVGNGRRCGFDRQTAPPRHNARNNAGKLARKAVRRSDINGISACFAADMPRESRILKHPGQTRFQTLHIAGVVQDHAVAPIDQAA